MTAQDTSRTGAALDLAPARPAHKARTYRRLPSQRDWPFWLVIAIQIGILAGGIALWQAAAVYGWIDGFFWSKPSDVYATLIKFFAAGDAWTDIGFTFQSTISGFCSARHQVHCWGCRSGGRAIMRRSCSPT